MSKENDLASAKRTIDREICALRVLEDNLDDDFIKALDVMEKCQGKIIVTGMGKSGHIGKKIAATLASTGSPSFFVHPGEASHGDLGMFETKDVVMAISNGGESKELSDVIAYCKRYSIPLISVTKNPDSSLGKAGDILLRLPNNGEACPLGLAPTSSTTATLVLGDVLAIALLERKGFTNVDYKQRHPGGKLGALLKKVSDLMHKGDDMPLVTEDETIQNALLVMTSKMLGCVGIIDRSGALTGIITDGDLRRFLSPDMFGKKVSELMTKNPKVITPDTLASEAIAFMNEKKITQLFAVQDNKPVGVIHLHDYLKAGVA